MSPIVSHVSTLGIKSRFSIFYTCTEGDKRLPSASGGRGGAQNPGANIFGVFVCVGGRVEGEREGDTEGRREGELPRVCHGTRDAQEWEVLRTGKR